MSKEKSCLSDILSCSVAPEIKGLRGIFEIVGQSVAYSPNRIKPESLERVFDFFESKLYNIEGVIDSLIFELEQRNM